jgi:hypothetical protein
MCFTRIGGKGGEKYPDSTFFLLQESSDTNSWIAFVQKKIICHRTCAVQLGVFTSLAKAMSAVVALDTKVY